MQLQKKGNMEVMGKKGLILLYFGHFLDYIFPLHSKF